MWKCIQSFFGGSSIPQLSPWDHCGRRSQYRAKPAKPFLSYTGWPGLPPGPGEVTDNLSAAHSPFSWEGGHREGLAEGRLLRFRIPQIPIEVVLKNITKPVQLAPVYLLHYTSDAFLQSIYILNDVFALQHSRVAILRETKTSPGPLPNFQKWPVAVGLGGYRNKVKVAIPPAALPQHCLQQSLAQGLLDPKVVSLYLHMCMN